MLKGFKNKEKVINKELFGKEILNDVEFIEIDFENELIEFTITEIDSEFRWFDIEKHEVDFDELKEKHPGILKGLIKEIKGIL
jgi:molecular chaperone GrpE (heat shock protein)|tara:strand:- start:380 stop:628 length:249 start_codon:yes stop_codon:yes gene_type:complete